MDDLYVESFFIKEKKSVSSQPLAPQTFLREERYEPTNLSKLYFEQLKQTIKTDIKDPEDYRFILARLEKKINEGDKTGILTLLNELEELLDFHLCQGI